MLEHLLHCMATRTNRSMQTAPCVHSAKSQMAHLCFCVYVWLRVLVCVRLCNMMVIFLSEGKFMERFV